MKRNWKEIKRDGVRAQWAGLYVTMNSKGTIVMNRATHERMDSPTAFHLLIDEANNTIGLKPTSEKMRNAYRASRSGRHGGKNWVSLSILQFFGFERSRMVSPLRFF